MRAEYLKDDEFPIFSIVFLIYFDNRASISISMIMINVVGGILGGLLGIYKKKHCLEPAHMDVKKVVVHW